ncbi:MAG TPA: LLM class flavin-dependent oxidoreductase [Hyalangium sp.]|nr:LLM class flavin-dependent oxidoreductase [Hyalangium sp.]
MELGLVTFSDICGGISAEQRIRNLLEEIVLADEVGLDVFGLGEHHRPDFAVSSPAVVLAAAAVRTKRIRLTSAVTVLSTADPVRVFQDFSLVDLLSGGRAEIMAGRGNFRESFPLFGYNMVDYEELFRERLGLLLKVREETHVTWSGRRRPALENAGVWPRPVQNPLPVWIAVGGTPSSVVRAATLGLPMIIAIIGGQPERFVPLVELYRETATRAGHDPAKLPIGINTFAFVAPESGQADEAFAPCFMERMTTIGNERGWPPMTREQYDTLIAPRGAIAAGNPEQVAEKILFEYELFKHQRFLAHMSFGPVAHLDVLRSIELFGTKVVPLVRAELARRQSQPPPPRAE